MAVTQKQLEICEAREWNVEQFEGECVEISQYTPAGEDFSFIVDGENLPEEVREYANNFDIDEHVEMWLEAKQAGRTGIPSARELVNDAEWLEEALSDLADALAMTVRSSAKKQTSRKPAPKKISNCHGASCKCRSCAAKRKTRNASAPKKRSAATSRTGKKR